MNRQYVPILKCKMGEQKALQNLSVDIKERIKPLIEIPLSPAMTKKTVREIINSFWEERDFFFYFMSDWYTDYEYFEEFVNEQIVPLCSCEGATPVIDLSLVRTINDWSVISRNGIAIRLRNNEFGHIEDMLNPLFSNGSVDRRNVDLIFDLQYIGSEDLFAKTSVIKAAFSDLDRADEFHSIIIASASFPKQFGQIESQRIYHFKRLETEIFALSLKLAQRFNFKYSYSDYGPTDIDESVFVVGMSPNFKIKYTTFDDYLYIKGIPVKRGGLDIGNVKALAQILVACNDYSGEKYSWGDKCIYDIANGILTSSGNLTTWISYAMNHHITFIVQQI